MIRTQPAVRALAVLLCAVVLPACGKEERAERPDGPAALAVNLQQTTCSDWRRASPSDRRAVVNRLAEVVRGPRREGRTLPDGRAHDILDARCGHHYARGFLLYEIYTRAVPFHKVTGEG